MNEIRLPEDTHLAYILVHEAWYWAGPNRAADDNRRSITVMASAKGQGGGVAWEFRVVEYDLQSTTLHLEMFADAFPALVDVTPLFAALGSGGVTTLADVRSVLDDLGAVDETERMSPYRQPDPVEQVALSARDLDQIISALENRGDDRNNAPDWRGLVERLRDHTKRR